MGPELSPIAMQYYCHVSPSVSCDQYNALQYTLIDFSTIHCNALYYRAQSSM